MTRTVEIEFETKAVNVKTAIDRFFVKHPSLKYWKETFEYMAENNEDFFSDITMADGTRNNDWAYALHLDINAHISDNKKDFYICVIERT